MALARLERRRDRLPHARELLRQLQSRKVRREAGVKGSPRVVEPGQPVPKGGGVYRVGKPYVVAGRTYVPGGGPHIIAPRASPPGTATTSTAASPPTAKSTTWRRSRRRIRRCRCRATCASPISRTAARSIVRVNDRGPYHANRDDRPVDEGGRTARFQRHGTARVRVEYVGRAPLEGTDDRQLLATLRDGEAAPTPSAVRVASRSPLGGLFRNDPAPRDRACGAMNAPNSDASDAPRFSRPAAPTLAHRGDSRGAVRGSASAVRLRAERIAARSTGLRPDAL